jgi:hydrogenase maturation protease
METKATSTIVIGLGNPILGDDGIGWRIVEQVRDAYFNVENQYANHHVDFELLSVGGLTLMEHMTGYDRAVIVDAISTGKQSIGSISYAHIEELPDFSTGHMSSAHDATIKHALELGRQLGAQLPSDISVLMIEADRVYNFSDQLSNRVAACLPNAVDIVMERIK